jgi:peptidyl-dipeptidase A
MIGREENCRVHATLSRRRLLPLLVAALTTVAIGCRVWAPTTDADAAERFVKDANQTIGRLSVADEQTGWIAATYVTPDTEAVAARNSQALLEARSRLAKEAVTFDAVTVPPPVRRQLMLLKAGLELAAPSDQKAAEELTRIAAKMEGDYGRARWCADPSRPDSCQDIEAITDILSRNQDAETLRRAWEGWHAAATPMRHDYARFVTLANQGARELGFADTGAMWRLRYEMPPDRFTIELDRLWAQVRPLYMSLHAYVRMKLREKYPGLIRGRGPIPAHLLGNLWAQDWSNVYPLVAPAYADPGYSLATILHDRQISPVDMVRMGERFYTSLGFAPLPQTFWERSLFVKPRDRDVVCHASAWDVDLVDDLRIKMCIDQNAEDFSTIHHELGHNFYQRAYNKQPVLFRESANDGFHEAVGDTIALSVTPEYLVRIGLLDTAPLPSRDIGLLLARALDKVALLPFSLLVDQWRWRVFSGQIPPERYNTEWWALKLEYQGVAPPSPRGEEFFDPGAKYHVASGTSYTRYFLASILQFQFHRALAAVSGCPVPLSRCSIYGSREAGRRLQAMMALGQSRPWPDALQQLTSSAQMDASAIRDYFAPLQGWLDTQLKGQPVGW